MKEALVSVIIPTHNRAALLKKAILSVVSQTYGNMEIIVIDDFSKDNTKQVVDKLKKKYKNIKYVHKSRDPHNPGATRNDGIKKANGKYIAFLDDDDEWFSPKIKLQLKAMMKDNRIGLCSTKYIDVSGNKKMERNGVGTSTVMVTAKCLKDVGLFDEKLTCAEDRDLYQRILKKYKKCFVDKVLAKHYIHKGQISSDIDKKIESEKYFIEKNRFDLKRGGMLHGHYFNLGSLFLKNGNFNEAKIYLKKSIQSKNNFLLAKTYLILTNFSPNLFRRFLLKFGR
ncbi:glycosyltransferase [archaeon]|jgi:glycosyltransferase involved in cell wall biosynthesis|nr:glycosyltransferase [archaeon]